MKSQISLALSAFQSSMTRCAYRCKFFFSDTQINCGGGQNLITSVWPSNQSPSVYTSNVYVCVCIYVCMCVIPEHSKCQWCFLCRIGSLPAPPSLSWEECHPTSIWLHALCYTNTCPSSPWSYQAPLPPWATAPFVTSSLTS